MRRPEGESKPKHKSKRKSKSVPRYRPIADLLNDKDVVNLFGQKKWMSQKEQIVWQHVIRALKGHLPSLNVLLKLAKEEPEDHGVPKMVVSYEPYRKCRSVKDQ